MWQPTQYYHTKMQLAKMELEGKMLSGKYKKVKRKTGSGPIMEKMRMLELTDEPDEENDLYETGDSAGQQVQSEDVIPEVQFTDQGHDRESELSEEVHTEKKKKKKKSEKRELEGQTAETEMLVEPEEEKAEQTGNLDVKDANIQMFSLEQMQDRMIWAEILGEPVSVKRRKKRVEQLYGNQGHAYRR